MTRHLGLAGLVALLGGCADDAPPPTVEDYLDDRILLDAAMARCGLNRLEMKYEADCVNAREASNRIARAEEAERRKALEAQSDRKRAALRRAQEAADEARRRAADAERARREAEYLSLFEASGDGDQAIEGAAAAPPEPALPGGELATDSSVTTEPAAPAPESIDPVEAPPTDAAPGTGTDLEAIREELRKRNDGTRR